MHTKFMAFKRSALLTVSALTVVAATLAPVAAFAEPKGGPGGGGGCPVEDEHGNVTYVPVGTVVGLFHCGSDGEWHWGWLTTNLASQKLTLTSTQITQVTAPATAVAK
jgi:hypothetical protein